MFTKAPRLVVSASTGLYSDNHGGYSGNKWHQGIPRQALPPDNSAGVIHPDDMKQLLSDIDSKDTDL
jgi:hypothetical protein